MVLLGYSFILTLYLVSVYVVRFNTCFVDVPLFESRLKNCCLHYERVCICSPHRELQVMI